MIEGVRYGHTNVIAQDWRRLVDFYVTLFGCEPVPPERDSRWAKMDARGRKRTMTCATSGASIIDDQWRADPLRLAVAGYLARYRGETRRHAESDLRAHLTWCQERALDPLAARRLHVELYVRWMQQTRRYAASTVSRRMWVICGLYRICVIDEILKRSPADYVRRPDVPPESPTLGLSHLQLEALLTASRTSNSRCDFALVCLLGLLGLRIFEACALDIADLGEEPGHRVLRVVGKGDKVVLIPLPPPVARSVDRAIGDRTEGPLLLNTRGRRLGT